MSVSQWIHTQSAYLLTRCFCLQYTVFVNDEVVTMKELPNMKMSMGYKKIAHAHTHTARKVPKYGPENTPYLDTFHAVSKC